MAMRRAAYALNNSVTDVLVTVVFGLAGSLMKRLAFEPAPPVLAFVLGPLMETTFRQALITPLVESRLGGLRLAAKAG